MFPSEVMGAENLPVRSPKQDPEVSESTQYENLTPFHLFQCTVRTVHTVLMVKECPG